MDSLKDPTVAVQKPSKKMRISAVLAKIELALHLSETYEFEKAPADSIAMSAADPVIPHTWVSEEFTTVAKRPDAPIRVPLLNGGTEITCRPGVNVILGKSGSGKTRFALKHLHLSARACGLNSVYLKAFEPGDEAELARIAPDVSPADFEGTLAYQIAGAFKDPSVPIIVIDSFRYLFYSSSGGAQGKGGVNMGLFMDLTHLDIAASRLGVAVFVVINPMTDDDTAFNFYVEAAVGAVTGVYIMDSFINVRYTERDSASRDFRRITLPKFTSVDAAMKKTRSETDIKLDRERSSTSNAASAVFGRAVRPRADV